MPSRSSLCRDQQKWDGVTISHSICQPVPPSVKTNARGEVTHNYTLPPHWTLDPRPQTSADQGYHRSEGVCWVAEGFREVCVGY